MCSMLTSCEALQVGTTTELHLTATFLGQTRPLDAFASSLPPWTAFTGCTTFQSQHTL